MEKKKRIVELTKTARLKHYCCDGKIRCSGIVPCTYIYVARKVSMNVLCEYGVIMTSALPFIAIFWQIRKRISRLVRVVNFSY